MTRTVLYVCHNHPAVRPGGAENYAYQLFEGMDHSDRYRAVFLAKGGPPMSVAGRKHEGTLIAPVGRRPNDYFLYTDGYTYDWINSTITDKDVYSYHVANFVAALRPDVVHIQHTNFIGIDIIRAIRNVLPDAGLVYTFHEFGPICHRQGQMLRTGSNELCSEASPRRCHECFPDIQPQQFFMRWKFIKSHLSLVDRFVAPSRFLLERYVEWGLPRERFVLEENGRSDVVDVPVHARQSRDRFAFFGQMSPYKGLDVLLEAFKMLGEHRSHGRSRLLPMLESGNGRNQGPAPHLFIHGANLDLQPSDYQSRIRDLVRAVKDDCTWVGQYEQRDLPRLMEAIDWVVVPSIWWENSPLVIQEAFSCGRPIICSDIGGMAEKVRDGIDGLHFRMGDPRHLSQVLERAASDPAIWEELRARRPTVHTMDEHVRRLSDLYDEVLGERAGRAVVHA